MNVEYNSDKYFVGAKFENKQGEIFEVIGKSDKKDFFFIKFKDENGFIAERSRTNIFKGNIKNPFHKINYGIGYIGVGKYKSSDKNRLTKAYNAWRGMLERCYCEETRGKYPTYKNVEVCEEWHNFQNFAKWFEKNNKKNWALDKDLKQKGLKKKIYSENTCIFIPRKINNYIKSLRIDNKCGFSCISYNKVNKVYVLRITDFDTGKEKQIKTSKKIEVLLDLRKKHFNIQNEKCRKYAKKIGIPEEIIEKLYKE